MFKYILLFIFLFNLNTFAKPNSFNSNKPIRIKSNEILVKKNKNLMVFTGKVEAKQDDLSIFTDKMYVRYKKNIDNKLEINNIKAFGNVVLKNKTITVKGDTGVYDLQNNLITLENNIILNENDAVVFGEKVIYNTITEEINIYGESDKNPKKERITIILDNINDLKDRYDD